MNKIIYLDSAASYLKDETVIKAQVDFLSRHYANSGRGICARAVYVDDMIMRARQRVAEFMNADENQIVFNSGTTDGMNTIVRMLNLGADKTVLVSDLDHHSARLPFVKSGANICLCPLDENFDIDIDNVPCADVFVITAMSNVLGRPQDVANIIKSAREKNPDVITVVDCAQYVVHHGIDVKSWDCDFACWSGHKIGADTGLGVMYIKNPEKFAPVDFGGGMVRRVASNDFILMDAPDCFEAGTLPLTQISGLVSAIDFLEKNRPDLTLIKYAHDQLLNCSKIKLISSRDAALLTFVVNDMHVLDFGALIGARGVCLRVGNMCATWIHERLGYDGSVRISIGAYNTMDEINTTIGYIKEILK